MNMKRLVFGVIAPLLFITLSLELSAQGPAKKDELPSGPFQASKSDPLQKLLKVPEVKDQLEACRKAKVEPKALDNCLWNGVTDGDKVIVRPLNAEIKKNITSYLKTEGKKPGEKGKTIDKNAGVVEHFDQKKDPAMVELEEYLSKRLRLALYGEITNDLAQEVGKVAENSEKKYHVVDHQVFHKLYENQISQNIISTVSSYCIEAQEKSKIIDGKTISFYAIPDTDTLRKAQRDENLELLKKNSSGDQVDAYGSWENCFKTIADVCYMKGLVGETSESKKRACAATRSIRGARQAILANQNIMANYQKILTGEAQKEDGLDFEIKKLDENAPRSGGPIFLEASNRNLKIVQYDPNDAKTSISRIATFSSGEILSQANEYSATQKAQVEKFKECYDEENNKIVDEEACRKYITDDREEQEEILAEMSMRTRAVSEQLKELEDEEQVIEFLRKEGHTQEEAEELISQSKGIEDLKKEINERYEAERRALIDQMAAQIDLRTLKEPGGAMKGSEGNLGKIQAELAQRELHFKQLVHYNNIVSGFLTITEGDESRSNAANISREMAFSAFNPEVAAAADKDGRAPGNAGDDYFESLNKALEKARGNTEVSAKDGTGTTTIGIENINRFLLRYKNTSSGQKNN